jgi:hypothetical protein
MYAVARLLGAKTDLREMLEDLLKLLSDEMGMKRGMAR